MSQASQIRSVASPLAAYTKSRAIQKASRTAQRILYAKSGRQAEFINK
jgi:hypothetical protein